MLHAGDLNTIALLAERANKRFVLPFAADVFTANVGPPPALIARTLDGARRDNRLSWLSFCSLLSRLSARNMKAMLSGISTGLTVMPYFSVDDPRMVGALQQEASAQAARALQLHRRQQMSVPRLMPTAPQAPKRQAPVGQPPRAQTPKRPKAETLCRNYSSGKAPCKYTAEGNICEYTHSCPCGEVGVDPKTHTCAKRASPNERCV